RLLAVLLGLLGIDCAGEQRFLRVGPELVSARLLDREGGPPEELRVLIGLSDDDPDGATFAGGDSARIAVAALQELDQAPSEGMLQVAQMNATRGLHVHA